MKKAIKSTPKIPVTGKAAKPKPRAPSPPEGQSLSQFVQEAQSLLRAINSHQCRVSVIVEGLMAEINAREQMIQKLGAKG